MSLFYDWLLEYNTRLIHREACGRAYGSWGACFHNLRNFYPLMCLEKLWDWSGVSLGLDKHFDELSWLKICNKTPLSFPSFSFLFFTGNNSPDSLSRELFRRT